MGKVRFLPEGLFSEGSMFTPDSGKGMEFANTKKKLRMNMKHLLFMLGALLIGTTACSQNSAEKFTPQNNADFARTIADTTVLLVDARTPAEYAAGHIPGAVNIDVSGNNFDKQVAALDKKRPVAVYCRSGNRSKAAARKFVSEGFRVYELDNGLNGWNGKLVK